MVLADADVVARHIQAYGLARGTLEPGVQTALAERLRRGGVLYDVGANIGFFSLLGARRVGPTGHVYAFEPVPENAAAIRANAAANGLANITVIEAAATRTSGSADLLVIGEASWSHLASYGDHPGTRRTLSTRTVAIDDLGDLRPPDVVKVDVEGAEIAALAGMERILGEHAPAIVCECHATNVELADLLERWEYSLANLDGHAAVRDAPPDVHVLATRGASKATASSLRACDLCGARDAAPVLTSPRLDGPLVRCRRCDLHYVGRRSADFTFARADAERSAALSDRVHGLDLVDHGVEDAEAPWHRRTDRERLAELARCTPGRRLLEVGSSAGGFLTVAAAAGWDVRGVEPDPITSDQARVRGLDVVTGTIEDASGSYDAIAMYHVIEHLDSPRATVASAAERLVPGGTLAIETPSVDGPWLRLLRRRWRQLIPDHYFFFSRATLIRLVEDAGFEVLDVHPVSRESSVRFVGDRVRRLNQPAGKAVARAISALGLEERTVRVRLGDVMRLHARRVG